MSVRGLVRTPGSITLGGTLANSRYNAAFVWGSTALLFFTWAFFRLPETKDRSFEQLDVLFAKKISARKFAKTDVDAFDQGETNELKQRYNV